MIKKNFLLLLVCLLAFTSCNNGSSSPSSATTSSITSNSNSTSSQSTSSITSSVTSSTSSSSNNSSSSSSSSSTSSQNPEVITSLADALTLGQALTGTDNTITGELITIKGKFLTYYADGNSHVATFSDGVNVLHVRFSASNNYYVGTSYQATGNISKYYQHIQLITTQNLQQIASIEVDVSQLARPIASIGAIHQELASLPISNKGSVSTDVISFTAQYIAKIDNSLLLVYDGENVIHVHGDRYINNSFSLGNTYIFYGMIGLYIYKPSINYLGSSLVSTGSLPESFTATKSISVEDIYRLDVDDEQGQFSTQILTFTGYVNAYKEDYVLVDDLKVRCYWQNGDVYKAKGLYVRDSDQYYVDDLLLDAYENESQITLTLVLYQYITGDHAWFVHLLG